MKNNKTNWLIILLIILGSLLILIPLCLTIHVALKTPQVMENPLFSLPNKWCFHLLTNFFNALGNSVFATTCVVILTVLSNLIVSYAIARIYVGYFKSIPVELEEAAVMDGASSWKVFWKVIFPLLAPMNATVAILTALYAWNDFLLPLVILTDSADATLPLTQYIFQSEFSTNYNLAFASYLLAMLPMILVYLLAQRWIIGNVTRGALK